MGGWIALLVRNDAHHEDARRLFAKASEEQRPLITSNLSIAETHKFLLHTSRRPVEALAWIRRILTVHHLTLYPAELAHHERALRWLHQFGDKMISYDDAVSFSIMETLGLKTVLGFDNDFRLAGFELQSSSRPPFNSSEVRARRGVPNRPPTCR